MSALTASAKSTTTPPFSCRIPEELLRELPEAQQRFYRQNDVLDQKMDWMIDHAARQSETLAEVNAKATETNGKIAKAVRDIEDLRKKVEAQAQETAPVIRTYHIAQKLVRSKVAWVAAAFIVLVGIPYLVTIAPAPLTFLKAAVTVLLGV